MSRVVRIVDGCPGQFRTVVDTPAWRIKLSAWLLRMAYKVDPPGKRYSRQSVRAA